HREVDLTTTRFEGSEVKVMYSPFSSAWWFDGRRAVWPSTLGRRQRGTLLWQVSTAWQKRPNYSQTLIADCQKNVSSRVTFGLLPAEWWFRGAFRSPPADSDSGTSVGTSSGSRFRHKPIS